MSRQRKQHILGAGEHNKTCLGRKSISVVVAEKSRRRTCDFEPGLCRTVNTKSQSSDVMGVSKEVFELALKARRATCEANQSFGGAEHGDPGESDCECPG